MTDGQLSTLLRDHVTRDEPAFPGPASVLERGRRRVRRRRLAAGTAVAAAALVAVAGGRFLGPDPSTPPAEQVDPAVQRALEDYEAAAMPGVLEDVAGTVLRRSIDALGKGEFAAYDAMGNRLPRELYDKASGMGMSWGERATTELHVALDHARGEAEGDHERTCAADLQQHSYLVCEVSTLPNGDVVVHRVGALRPAGDRPRDGWYVGNPAGMDLADPTTWPVRGDLWLQSTVEVIKSETFRTLVSETVKASTVATGEVFSVPTDDLTRIAGDPRLVLPEPPADPDGCGAWTLPGSTSQQACE